MMMLSSTAIVTTNAMIASSVENLTTLIAIPTSDRCYFHSVLLSARATEVVASDDLNMPQYYEPRILVH